MAYKKYGSGVVMKIVLVFSGVMAFSGCSELGKKYVAFKVTSDPPGASVDSLMDNKISGGTFVNASLGTTPTGIKVAHFAFGAPGVGDTKLGVRVDKSGYKAQELFFDTSDWYDTAEEARRHVKEISMVLERLPASESTPAESHPRPQGEVSREAQPARESDVRPKDAGKKDAKVVNAGQFQFTVPATWTRAPKSEEDELKRTMLAGVKKMVDTSKAPLKFDQFYVFQTPKQGMVLVNAVPIPEKMSAHDYMIKLLFRTSHFDFPGIPAGPAAQSSQRP